MGHVDDDGNVDIDHMDAKDVGANDVNANEVNTNKRDTNHDMVNNDKPTHDPNTNKTNTTHHSIPFTEDLDWLRVTEEEMRDALEQERDNLREQDADMFASSIPLSPLSRRRPRRVRTPTEASGLIQNLPLCCLQCRGSRLHLFRQPYECGL